MSSPATRRRIRRWWCALRGLASLSSWRRAGPLCLVALSAASAACGPDAGRECEPPAEARELAGCWVGVGDEDAHRLLLLADGAYTFRLEPPAVRVAKIEARTGMPSPVGAGSAGFWTLRDGALTLEWGTRVWTETVLWCDGELRIQRSDGHGGFGVYQRADTVDACGPAARAQPPS